MKITTLLENTSGSALLRHEHWLSLLNHFFQEVSL